MQRMTTGDGEYTAQYWRSRAEKTRLQTKVMHDTDTKVTMYMLAEMYDRLAEGAKKQGPKNMDS